MPHFLPKVVYSQWGMMSRRKWLKKAISDATIILGILDAIASLIKM